MVSAYFKNVGQTRTLIQLLQDRSVIQQVASQEMREKFAHYNLELEEVLIGTPASDQNDQQIETILTQLRSRQIAEEQVETYVRQEKAAVQERELREAESRARMQTNITESELNVTVQGNQGKAEYQRSVQQAAQIRTLAEADAERIARTGIAQALATEEQVRAYGGPQFQVTQQVLQKFADAIQQSGVDIVPRVLIKGNAEGDTGTGSVIEALMAMLLSEKLGASVTDKGERSPEIEALRKQIRDSMKDNPGEIKPDKN